MTGASRTAVEAAEVAIRLDRRPPLYAPGEKLTATVLLAPGQAATLRKLEISIVWCTAGLGDEDLHVHEFARHAFDPQPTGDVDEAKSTGPSFEIATTLPRAPLSYAGVIVKVCWAVRVRLFDADGKQSLIEQPFQLGAVEAPAIAEELAEAAAGAPESRGLA